jgi:hypothetical protein
LIARTTTSTKIILFMKIKKYSSKIHSPIKYNVADEVSNTRAAHYVLLLLVPLVPVLLLTVLLLVLLDDDGGITGTTGFVETDLRIVIIFGATTGAGAAATGAAAGAAGGVGRLGEIKGGEFPKIDGDFIICWGDLDGFHGDLSGDAE